MPDNQKNRFIKKAIEIANQNIENGGGPFGALVVKDGQVIAEGRNKVTNNNDPTAHAEVIAIRNACKVLNTFQLTGCEIYSSCEPCPMCFAAIYWARPKAVYYAATKYDAAQAGFDDEFIYKELELKEAERQIPFAKVCSEESTSPFETWNEIENKKLY